MEGRTDRKPGPKWVENPWLVTGACSALGANALLALYAVGFGESLVIAGGAGISVARPAAWFGVAMILPVALAVGYARGMAKGGIGGRRWLPLLAVSVAGLLGLIQLTAWCL